MNIKVNFTSKLTKANAENCIVLVKDNKIKNRILNPIIKSVLDNQLFKDDLFTQKEFKKINYIFVNCKKILISSDFENIGSKLFDYLKKNKIEILILIVIKLIFPKRNWKKLFMEQN